MSVSRAQLSSCLTFCAINSAAVALSDYLLKGFPTLISSAIMAELCRIVHGFQGGGSKLHCDSYQRADPSYSIATLYDLLAMIVSLCFFLQGLNMGLRYFQGNRPSQSEKEWVFLRLPFLLLTFELSALCLNSINQSDENFQSFFIHGASHTTMILS